ncbi:formimidoylglutamase [Niabella ginsenosidivorans]|uniref:Formimidoylglutamase n=1 Tax=Niabella ginsenosidivorans TaxID=1176587 RepID=A0A1A9HXU5_9BACT|nr:formimidoylglutamase [Niabella ginsenosidivorans]ANH80207.1 formimidoylglutamase [Niabella ginsenosidivorans]
MALTASKAYQAASAENWVGRKDGKEAAYERWGQVVKILDLKEALPELKRSFVMIGYCCDEGVRRNQGRVGAAKGPDHLRVILKNLPVHHPAAIKIYDAGNIYCQEGDLEETQTLLAHAVSRIIAAGGFPLVLGGGHDLAYGHFTGIQNSIGNQKKIGIINFDAHFDLRAPDAGSGNSGTGFYQVAMELKAQGRPFYYLPVGIQRISNTKKLFEVAKEFNVSYIDTSLLNAGNLPHLLPQLQQFLDRVDVVYLTVDLDVFSAAQAPGVSATAFNGIEPGHCFFTLLRLICQSGKLRSLDIAELNPDYDIDSRTAKLAADILFNVLLEL